jgi:mitochondrial fission protein ELM1
VFAFLYCTRYHKVIQKKTTAIAMATQFQESKMLFIFFSQHSVRRLHYFYWSYYCIWAIVEYFRLELLVRGRFSPKFVTAASPRNVFLTFHFGNIRHAWKHLSK